jgi:hypothetical protein
LGQSVADRYPEVRERICPSGRSGLKHVRGVSGVSPSKAAGGSALEGENPRGASSQLRAKHPSTARDSGKGQSLEVEVLCTGSRVCPAGDRRGLTACGFSGRGNAFATLREGNAPEGSIPGTLSGRNKPDQVPRGVTRQEGNQTLKAERSGHWHGPRQVDPRRRKVL